MRSPSSLAFACLLASLSACVDNDGPSLYIRANALHDDECKFSGEDYVLRGIFDLNFARSYTLHPIYQSQLRTRATEAPLAADPNTVVITGAEVEIRDISGAVRSFGAFPNPFSVPAAGRVPSFGPTSAGRYVGDLEAIPPAYTPLLVPGETIVLAVRVFGETESDVDITTEEFLWPIDLCATPDNPTADDYCLVVPSNDDFDSVCCTCGNDNQCEFGAPACNLP